MGPRGDFGHDAAETPCRASCEATAAASTSSRSVTTAAAVSSQVVSKVSTFMARAVGRLGKMRFVGRNRSESGIDLIYIAFAPASGRSRRNGQTGDSDTNPTRQRGIAATTPTSSLARRASAAIDSSRTKNPAKPAASQNPNTAPRVHRRSLNRFRRPARCRAFATECAVRQLHAGRTRRQPFPIRRQTAGFPKNASGSRCRLASKSSPDGIAARTRGRRLLPDGHDLAAAVGHFAPGGDFVLVVEACPAGSPGCDSASPRTGSAVRRTGRGRHG